MHLSRWAIYQLNGSKLTWFSVFEKNLAILLQQMKAEVYLQNTNLVISEFLDPVGLLGGKWSGKRLRKRSFIWKSTRTASQGD